jgi:hypothetical protein
MRREDALLYLCCTQELPPERLERLVDAARGAPWAPALDWRQVFALAHAHGVAPLVHQNLQIAMAAGAAIPGEVAQRFKLAAYQNVLAKQKQADRLISVLPYLQANQFDAMIVKGLALDLVVYDQPWYTVAQDVDLVLRRRGEEMQPRRNATTKVRRRHEEGTTASSFLPSLRVLRVLRGKNLRGETRATELAARFHGLGVEFELDSHHDVTLNGALAVDFDQIWRDARVVEYHGYPLYLMAPEDLLLAVCINSCRKRYFRLRSLCDIAETVKRFPELDWASFAGKAIAYGCNNIVYTAFSVAEATVAASVPRGALDRLAIGATRRLITDQAIQRLVRHVPLASLSYYTGSDLAGRKVGWSLVLPYLTYRWRQMGSKLHEALTAYLAPRS